MNAIQLESKFAAVGARMKVREIPSHWRQGDRSWIQPQDFAMDLRRDGHGQFFELRVPTHLSESLEISVMQALPEERHLLLAVRHTAGKPQLDRFLCGAMQLALGKKETLGQGECLFPARTPVGTTFYSRHVLSPFHYEMRNHQF